MKTILAFLRLPFVTSESCDDGSTSPTDVIRKHLTTTQEKVTASPPWILLPMASSSLESSSGDQKNNLQSSDLGSKLADALERVRHILSKDCGEGEGEGCPIAFLGMDSPELPIGEIANAMHTVGSNTRKAYINPAHDGGYGMLCVPPQAPVSIFKGVRWSSSLSAISQMKALSDNGIDAMVGSLMNDIDEPDDVMNLAIRLSMLYSKSRKAEAKANDAVMHDPNRDRLSYRSEVLIATESEVDDANPFLQERVPCPQTFEALLELGLVEQRERKGRFLYTTVMSKWSDTTLI